MAASAVLSNGQPVIPAGAQPAGSSGGMPPIIPDAGVYGAQTAAANNAYENAVTQATAQRNALYNQYGLNNTGSVDSNNPYGQYQQMLGAQAGQQMADTENTAARNLGGSGLANQQSHQDQNANNAQDWQFQNQLAGVGSNYENSLQNALGTKQSTISQAYQNAMQVALQNMIAEMQAGVYSAPKPPKSPKNSGGDSGSVFVEQTPKKGGK